MGGRWGELGSPLFTHVLFFQNAHEMGCEVFLEERVLSLREDSVLATSPGVLVGAVARLACLTFGLGVIMNWAPRSGECMHVTGGRVSCVCTAIWGLLGWGRGMRKRCCRCLCVSILVAGVYSMSI